VSERVSEREREGEEDVLQAKTYLVGFGEYRAVPFLLQSSLTLRDDAQDRLERLCRDFANALLLISQRNPHLQQYIRTRARALALVSMREHGRVRQ